MAAATGMIAELARAFDMANVEMFAILLPEARVAAVTNAVLRKWNCAREELLGRQLVKFGTGSLSARNVTENGPDGTVNKVEVSYIPPLGNVAVDQLFSPDLGRPGPEVHAAHRPACQPGAGRNRYPE